MRLLLATICILLLSAGAGMADLPNDLKSKVGVVEGQFVVDSKPLPYAIISFFSSKGGPAPLDGRVQRVPDMVSRTDADGRFTARLLTGTYYMGALIRRRGAGPGPPQKGEPRYFALKDNGEFRLFEVKPRQTDDVGVVTGVKRGAKKGLNQFILVQGNISDENGQPMAGAVVVVKTSLEQSRPSFVSDVSTADGQYRLKLPPGKYYLMVREGFSGVSRPGPGTYVGLYGSKMPIGAEAPFNTGGGLPGALPRSSGLFNMSSEAKLIQGSHGDVFSDIDIQLFRIPDPVETRKKFEGEARATDWGNDEQGGDKHQPVGQEVK